MFPEHYYKYPPDSLLIEGTNYIGIVIAIVVGVFIGTDYSNGTIRNKHVMGHSRVSIYLSNLIVCVTASTIMHTAYMAVVIGASSIEIIKKFEMSDGNVVALFFITVFAMALLTAIFLFVCMLVTSRTAGSVSVIILSLILLIAAAPIHQTLLEEEYYSIIAEDDSNMEINKEHIKNPYYLTKEKRKIFEFLDNSLPYNQIIQLKDNIEFSDHTVRFPLYSLSLIVVTTAAGVLLFHRKDLK